MMAESDQTSADGGPILDHIVAEVVQMLQNKRAVPVDPAEVRVLVEQEWARYAMPGCGPSSRCWSGVR